MAQPHNIYLIGALWCAIMSAPSTAYAAGFALSERGAGPSGVAGAATAREDLAGSLLYNPAIIAARRPEIPGNLRILATVGASLLAPTVTYTAPDGEATDTVNGPTTSPRSVFGFGTKRWGITLTQAVRFGSRIEWPDDWAGRTAVTSSRLQVVDFEVNGAWRPVPWLALAAGPRFQQGQLGIERAIDVADPERDARVEIAARGWGFAGQASALASPGDAWDVGVSYRSRTHLTMSGGADFSDIPVELSQQAQDTRLDASLVLPPEVALGGAWRWRAGVVSMDITYTGWQTVDAITIDFDEESVEDTAQQRDWRATPSIRAGYEHRLFGERLALRAGAAFEPTPVPDETVGPSSPDGDRWIGAIGAGYRSASWWVVDLSATYTFISERVAMTTPIGRYSGRYSGRIFSVGLDVGVDIP